MEDEANIFVFAVFGRCFGSEMWEDVKAQSVVWRGTVDDVVELDPAAKYPGQNYQR